MRVLKTRFRSKRAFLEAYSEELPHGGLFCPTTTELAANEVVAVEIHFPELPNKMMLRGTVVWWRAALPRLRVRAGAMVAFDDDETGKREFLLEVAAGQRTDAVKRRHARLPIAMPVRWRLAQTTDQQESELREISIGGAQLVTDQRLEHDDEIVVDLVTPGGAQPISIAAKVTYRTPLGYGLRFLYRDGGGSRRLRELFRRLAGD